MLILEVAPVAQPAQTANVVTGGPAGQCHVLASDADRDGAAGMLSSAFAEGRLTSGEHAERVRAAYEARTLGELAGLTADLPGPAGEAGSRRAMLAPGERVDRCLLCALLICCPPAGIAWLLAARRRPRRGPALAQGPAPALRVGTAADGRGSCW
jgi:Domain of unknown function (DUF1707)